MVRPSCQSARAPYDIPRYDGSVSEWPMKILLEQIGIALCGLITTIVVVFVNIRILHWIHWDLVGFSYNLIPVGAIAGGAIAASGYYFGARYSHNRASRSLLVLMVIIAGLAFVLMYWDDYVTLDVDGTPASKLMSFAEFIHFRVTTTHLRIRFLDFRVGWFGYVLSLVDFVGFLSGGFVVYSFLESQKQCPSCKLYLDTLGSMEYVVESMESATEYLEAFAKLANGDSTALTIIGESSATSRTSPGSLRISTTLLGCPVCKRQFTQQRVAVFVGKDWKDIDSLTRESEVVTGVDLVPYCGSNSHGRLVEGHTDHT
jgi:hypothetical protein